MQIHLEMYLEKIHKKLTAVSGKKTAIWGWRGDNWFTIAYPYTRFDFFLHMHILP